MQVSNEIWFCILKACFCVYFSLYYLYIFLIFCIYFYDCVRIVQVFVYLSLSLDFIYLSLSLLRFYIFVFVKRFYVFLFFCQKVLYVYLYQEFAKDEFEVELCVEEAGFVVKRLKEPTTRCVVSLTSPIIREEIMTGISVVFKLKAVFFSKSYHLTFIFCFRTVLFWAYVQNLSFQSLSKLLVEIFVRKCCIFHYFMLGVAFKHELYIFFFNFLKPLRICITQFNFYH